MASESTAAFSSATAPDARPGQPPRHDHEHAHEEIDEAATSGTGSGCVVTSTACDARAETHDGEQHQRHEQPVKVDETDDAPREIARAVAGDATLAGMRRESLETRATGDARL